MAAKNNDSKNIFDLYVNKFLTEQETDQENKPIPFQSEAGKKVVQGLSNFGSAVKNAFTGPSYDERVAQAEAEKATTPEAGAEVTKETENPAATTTTASTDNPFASQQSYFSTINPQGVQGDKNVNDLQASQQQSQTASAQPTPEEVKQYGQTGAELRQTSGGQFTSRADRMDQSKVDAILGQGKYKAGTAEANLALANYFKNNPNTVTTGRPSTPAGSLTATTAAPAAPAAAALPTSTAPAQGINVPSWKNMAGINQGQGPTPLNLIKQQFQAAGITASDDQINKFAKAVQGLS
jgi:hypothetical protein